MADLIPTVDALGTLCPEPIILIAAAIKEVAPGEQVRLIADDPGTERDLIDWTRALRHEIIELRRGPGSRVEARIRRRPS